MKTRTPRTAPRPATLYLERQAASTRATQYSALRNIACMLADGPADPELFPWHRITFPEAARVRAVLVEGYAPATVNRYLVAFRGVLAESWALEQLSADARDRLCHGLRNVRVGRLQRGRVLPAGELAAIFAACTRDLGPAAARDAAVVAVMAGTGARRDEVARLDVGDVDLAAATIRVIGKGNVERSLPATPTVAGWVQAWLEVRGTDPGPLFPPIHAGTVGAGRIGPSALWRVVTRRARQAELVRPATPHDLRRTHATSLLEAGADLHLVAQLLGHQSVNTTIRYDRRGDAARRQAAELLHLPEPPKKAGGGKP